MTGVAELVSAAASVASDAGATSANVRAWRALPQVVRVCGRQSSARAEALTVRPRF
jgi:hypothetical protein